MSECPEPFRIAVPDSELEDLHRRLDQTRWPDELPHAGWDYGVPRGYLRELADHWRHRYDWRVHEARLNQLPQFTTTIDGTSVHFVHVRSAEPGAVPLLVLHGWPGSIAELTSLIAPLTDPVAHGGAAADAFHVIAPSLPGYGLSGPTPERGWSLRRVTRAMAALMSRLGYARYAAHGGDWGAAIARGLGVVGPERLLGIHLTMLLSASARRSDADRDDPEERRSLEAGARYRSELSGYAILQGTRPQTLAYALTDSPVGQLAWIAEKFKDWTDSRNVPEDAVDRDQLLTNVMLYWLTRTAGSSARLYYETGHDPVGATDRASAVPIGVAVFPHDLAVPVRRRAEQTERIVRWTPMDRGGHFPAMEQPELLTADIRSFFRSLR